MANGAETSEAGTQSYNVLVPTSFLTAFSTASLALYSERSAGGLAKDDAHTLVSAVECVEYGQVVPLIEGQVLSCACIGGDPKSRPHPENGDVGLSLISGFSSITPSFVFVY